jgi:YD repeat-containing protein
VGPKGEENRRNCSSSNRVLIAELMQSDGAAPHPILNMTNVHMSIDAEERRPDAAAGNRTTKTALQQADPTPVSALSEFSYDNIYQLTQTLVDQSLAESYTYDAVGNRLTSVSPASYTYNASNQLTATSAAT